MPELSFSLQKIRIFATNERWQEMPPKEIRKFNKKQKEVTIFRIIELTASVRMTSEKKEEVVLLENFPLRLQSILKKKRLELVLGIQINLEIPTISIQLAKSQLAIVTHFLIGLLSCFTRQDLPVPALPPSMPKDFFRPRVVINVNLKNVELRLVDPELKGAQ